MGTLYFTKRTIIPLGRCFRFSGGNRSIRTTSNQARDAKKAKKATLIVKGVAVAFETAIGGVHA
jgi:hypothetical protein